MAFVDIWKNIFKQKHKKQSSLVLGSPLYTSSFGNDVYESDIVLACINVISEECSKMIIRSVKTANGAIIPNNDDLNRLFKSKPNPLMIMKDLLYWTAWRLETRSNAYWFPEVEIWKYEGGRTEEHIVAIYPIDSDHEEMFYSEEEKEYYIQFTLKTGSVYQVLYKNIIHFKKNFSSNNYYFGEVSRKELLKTLKINDLITNLLPKGLQISMQTKGVLTAKAAADAVALREFKKEFEDNINKGDTGLAVMDIAAEFTPININPQLIDKEILEYLENKILKTFNVSIGILMGKATEDEWSSFYSSHVEGFKIALEQACTSGFFNNRTLSFGNEIRCYDKLTQHLSIKTRLEIVKELGQRGYLSRAEQRDLLGYEPDGGPEKVSLNYIDSDKANEYQLNTSKKNNKQNEEKTNE